MREAALALTVLGSSCSIPRPSRACSSYLLRYGDEAIVLDIGTGSFANLRTQLDPSTLDAIVITHMHSDHFLDLIPMRYALRYASSPLRRKIPVYIPPAHTSMLTDIGRALSREDGDFFRDVYDISEYKADADTTLRIGSFSLRFMPTTHYIQAYAVRVEVGETVFTYSADTAYDERLLEIAKDSDFFLCEATLGAHGSENGVHGHSSAVDAARMANKAGVRCLLLTHYGADVDPNAMLAAAQAEFPGSVGIADDGMHLMLTADLAHR